MLGQTLTSEADATGLGSGVADAHLATFADIVQYDAGNLEETLTTDLVRIVQRWNFSGSERIKLRLRIDTEALNVQQKMQSFERPGEHFAAAGPVFRLTPADPTLLHRLGQAALESALSHCLAQALQRAWRRSQGLRY